MEAIRGTVLIVDDEPHILELLQGICEKDGHRCELAEDGQAAWEILQNRPVDIVLADIKTPRMDGLQLLTHCRNHNVWVPFIFISAYGSSQVLLQALKLSAYDFFDKPFHDAEISQLVREALIVSRIQSESKAKEDGDGSKDPAEIVRNLDFLSRIRNTFQHTPDPRFNHPDPRLSTALLAERVAEQLAGSDRTLRKLEQGTRIHWYLGQLFRTMLAVESASALLGAKDIEAFAGTFVDVYARLRCRPARLTPEIISTLRVANDLLLTQIGSGETTVDPLFSPIHESLKEAVAQLG